jgi:hypothetical protein
MSTFSTTSFTPRVLNGNGVASRSLGKPAARFPAAVATDSDLAIAVDRQQTTLALPLDSVSTSMTVTNAASITAYNLLSIDSEIVKVTGAPTGNVVPIARGFDGTTPAIHLSSATVSGLIDAWHHNALVAEVEAIEQTLGTNLSRIPASPLVVSSNYIFPAQTPGGTLTVGTNSILLTPVPPGVNGTNGCHDLWISGGTGAAEAVRITGGTAVAGAPSGTVFVTCANSHSGAWTIQSATAGIVEAIQSLPAGGGSVYVPPGTWNTNAPITVCLQHIQIEGSGDGGSVIQANFTSGSIVFFTAIGNGTGGPYGFYNSIYRVRLLGPASPGTLVGIQVRGQLGLRIIDNSVTQVLTGIWVNDTSGSVSSAMWIHRNFISPVASTTGAAIYVNGGADHFIINNHMTSSPSAPSATGILFTYSLGSKLVANEVYGFTNAVLMVPSDGLFVATVESIGNWYDSSQGDVFKIVPQGTGTVTEITINSDRIAAGTGNGLAILGNASNILGIIVSNARIMGNHVNGIDYTGGADVELANCHVYGNSSGSSGTNHGLFIAAGASNLRVKGGTYAQSTGSPGGPPPNTQGYGIWIAGGASDYLVIDGPVCTPNVTGGLISGALTGTHNVIRNVIGYNPVGQAAITVGASPFVYTAGTSPEMIYISGGTVSSIKVGATQVAAASPAAVALSPNGSLTVTYTAAPTMVKDVQ